MISIIVAVAENGVIGNQNRLLWHIAEDLRRFRHITTGHPVVMGRKTWESLGRPLPGRENVVVTRQELSLDGARTVHSLAEAYSLFPPEEEVFIIGGAQIYAEALPWPTASISRACIAPTRATRVFPSGMPLRGGSRRASRSPAANATNIPSRSRPTNGVGERRPELKTEIG